LHEQAVSISISPSSKPLCIYEKTVETKVIPNVKALSLGKFEFYSIVPVPRHLSVCSVFKQAIAHSKRHLVIHSSIGDTIIEPRVSKLELVSEMCLYIRSQANSKYEDKEVQVESWAY
jgi:hypothetical protein